MTSFCKQLFFRRSFPFMTTNYSMVDRTFFKSYLVIIQGFAPYISSRSRWFSDRKVPIQREKKYVGSSKNSTISVIVNGSKHALISTVSSKYMMCFELSIPCCPVCSYRSAPQPLPIHLFYRALSISLSKRIIKMLF